MKNSDENFLETCSTSNDLKVATELSIPKKSLKKYQLSYSQFLTWQKDNEKNSFSENILLTYFQELSKKMKSSSLWSQYSMLRANLNIYNDTDISKYTKLKAFLKGKSDGYCPKKSKTFTAEDINKFLDKAPDHVYLLAKVVMIMGIACGCRKDELYKMKINQITHMEDGALIEIPQTNTKTTKKYTIKGNFYNTLKKYLNLHPEHSTYLFLNYVRGKCNAQRVGINKIGHMGKQIAQYLKLPDPHLYTGHCFRRSSTTILVDHYNVTALPKPVRIKTSIDAEIPDNTKIIENNNTNKECTTTAKIEVITENAIPEKSRKKYEISYNQFLTWQKENQQHSLSENVILTYFIELSKKFKSSSLWTQYSMLKANLNIHNNTDIGKYNKLKSFLRGQAEGYSPKQSNVFTVEEMNRFLDEAPDCVYLLPKIVMIMGITCGCRKDELYNMQIDHVTHIDNGTYLVEIPQTSTDTTKKFTIKGTAYDYVKKYIDLRPPHIKCIYFFINYRKEIVQRVGINKIGTMGKLIAEFLELPNPHLYTGFCFRRSYQSIDSSQNISSLEKSDEMDIHEDEVTEDDPCEDNLEVQIDESDSACAIHWFDGIL